MFNHQRDRRWVIISGGATSRKTRAGPSGKAAAPSPSRIQRATTHYWQRASRIAEATRLAVLSDVVRCRSDGAGLQGTCTAGRPAHRSSAGPNSQGDDSPGRLGSRVHRADGAVRIRPGRRGHRHRPALRFMHVRLEVFRPCSGRGGRGFNPAAPTRQEAPAHGASFAFRLMRPRPRIHHPPSASPR